MRVSPIFITLIFVVGAPAARTAMAQEPPTVAPVVTTAPLVNYEGAPATPDADDPAIWINHRQPRRSLVIGTAKDAGLVVYNLAGEMVQAIRPPNAPQVSAVDPPTPAGVNPNPDRPCLESESGETFGRFNNVDIAYDVKLGAHGRADVAVVSDRGCDRIRFYRIDPTNQAGPLIDITAPAVGRVFPTRYDQPSALQPSGLVEGWHGNPIDDQNTVYGLTVVQRSGRTEVFVTQRERGLIRQLEIAATPQGRLSYQTKRTFLFVTSFDLLDAAGATYAWTPCREAALEEPQAEGIEFDTQNSTLFVGFETIGLYKLAVRESWPALVTVGKERLIEPITSFGRSYRATPDDDEFECDYDADGDAAGDAIVAPGSNIHAGEFLEADLEGLSVIATAPGYTLLLASSQGDSSFHLYGIGRRATHLGEFLIEDVGETDGVDVAPVPLGPAYPAGLLVVQNGAAPEPEDTGDVNGFEFDGSTQFKFVSFLDALKAVVQATGGR